jgi:hypothetical protein
MISKGIVGKRDAQQILALDSAIPSQSEGTNKNPTSRLDFKTRLAKHIELGKI